MSGSLVVRESSPQRYREGLPLTYVDKGRQGDGGLSTCVLRMPAARAGMSSWLTKGGETVVCLWRAARAHARTRAGVRERQSPVPLSFRANPRGQARAPLPFSHMPKSHVLRDCPKQVALNAKLARFVSLGRLLRKHASTRNNFQQGFSHVCLRSLGSVRRQPSQIVRFWQQYLAKRASLAFAMLNLPQSHKTRDFGMLGKRGRDSGSQSALHQYM